MGSQKVRVSQDVVRGKHGYRLTIGELSYEMVPQVDLGATDGVQFASRPDFVLWPVQKGRRPVAIFLDGYAFHADTLEDDLLKRQALMHAGFVVWTLNWYDINQVMGDKALEVPLPAGMTSSEQNNKAITALAAVAEVSNVAEHLVKTPFELLMHFLMEQDAHALAKQGLLFAFQCLPGHALSDPAVRQQALASLDGLPASFTDLQPESVALAGAVTLTDNQSRASMTLNLLASRQLLTSADLTQASINLRYDANDATDTALYAWQRFWCAVNFLQFLPVFYAWTPQMNANGSAAGLLWPTAGQVSGTASDGGTQNSPAWFDYVDKDLADVLKTHTLEWPETAMVGEPVMNDDEEIIGEVELMFEAQKIAFLLDNEPDQLAARAYLEANGWQVFTQVDTLAAAMNHMDAGA
ncbi:hypothetical protein HLB35_00210 [Halomonas sp. TBZ9]|uniref:Uncharacterized protein n=1 Tax=Vreelandella azerica TaxID=2732867 RepID=A0A7Y3X9T8_9GAMM|nr:hypothetical protein [Halomonas azerica]NOG30583.1 hypothetical protein [Halomonas azerica]